MSEKNENGLHPENLQRVVQQLPEDVRRLLQRSAPGRVFVAGGFVRDALCGWTEPQDIDLWGDDETTALAEREIRAARPACRVFSTENATTILHPPQMPVQVITRWKYSDPEALVRDFDFTQCAAAVYCEPDGRWTSRVHERFLDDVSAGRLVYTAPARDEDAGGSMMRVAKFLRRGWHITPEALGKVAARLVVGLHGDEPALGQAIGARLREVDPLFLVDGVEVVDEHKQVNP